MNLFKVSYVTTLPKIGNAPSVSIFGDIDEVYTVLFYDYGKELISSGYCETNNTILCGKRQWYTDWHIVIKNEDGEIVHQTFFNLENETVFIKIDSYALGDNIAWIPYVEEFRKKHKCRVICSTFFNDLFAENYPDILFVRPNITIENIYTQYYVGADIENNEIYCPIKVNELPLQMVAVAILGLDVKEIRPNLTSKYLNKKFEIKRKYVTLSEFGSFSEKKWMFYDGWQHVVDFLNYKGFDVVVISKEKTYLENVIDLTGELSLNSRAIDIFNAEFHLGISSGLSWLAWGLGKHVVMISDVTPHWHEFQTDITRFCANELNEVNYLSKGQTKPIDVISKLGDLIDSRYL
jgi:autotransporter strand-loop-strand O-heptosyltransferase